MGMETEQAEVINAGARLGPYPIDHVSALLIEVAKAVPVHHHKQ